MNHGTLGRMWFPLAKYIAYANGEVEDQKGGAPELRERWTKGAMGAISMWLLLSALSYEWSCHMVHTQC